MKRIIATGLISILSLSVNLEFAQGTPMQKKMVDKAAKKQGFVSLMHV